MKYILNLFLLSMLLSSCAGLNLTQGYQVRNNYNSPPSCFQSYKSNYKNLKECENSDEYKQLFTIYEEQQKYRIYDRGYSLNGVDQIYCGSKIDTNNYPSTLPAITKTTFASLEECNNSDELKKTRLDQKANILKKNKLAEAKRIALIDSFIKENPSASSFRKSAIEKKIELEMPEQLVYHSWGKPKTTNNSVGRYGVHKQLVYGNRTYVYIKNGKVSSWQN